ncbi:hypothetical protein HBN50_14400 [Halobacteriovorax sp. GB3]|uniref:hypothetical protein n=1 Tax=Halobacteriovorax sp. GB3 TaxID=2719615 RepID=UPI0023625D2D|nr:hypothetical protein [Halobacteriovorax sp. GB3]MDD0854300.1 hypothetical protein [Halobacteriovorax sp. GB3]
MKIQYIVAGMVITLAILFLLSPRFRRNEKELTLLEASFFERLKLYQSENNEENKNALEIAAREYFSKTGLKGQKLEDKINEVFN